MNRAVITATTFGQGAELPMVFVVLSASFLIVLGLAYWLMERFGGVRFLLMALVAWPAGTAWYALTLDSMDLHFVDRWLFGVLEAGKILACVVFTVLGGGLIASPRWWARVFEAYEGGRRWEAWGAALLTSIIVVVLVAEILFVWVTLTVRPM